MGVSALPGKSVMKVYGSTLLALRGGGWGSNSLEKSVTQHLNGLYVQCSEMCHPIDPMKYAGLDIGYVPAGPDAFFRWSGQFGPQQLIFY